MATREQLECPQDVGTADKLGLTAVNLFLEFHNTAPCGVQLAFSLEEHRRDGVLEQNPSVGRILAEIGRHDDLVRFFDIKMSCIFAEDVDIPLVELCSYLNHERGSNSRQYSTIQHA